MTATQLEVLTKRLEAPVSEEDIAFAKKCEEGRCEAVDRFYREAGIERASEASIARQTYGTKTPRNSRELAYS
jgi:hypothetical protein